MERGGTPMLGDVVRTAPLRHGWAQEPLARRIGATQRMITGLERGKVRRPHARRPAPLAEALGLIGAGSPATGPPADATSLVVRPTRPPPARRGWAARVALALALAAGFLLGYLLGHLGAALLGLPHP